MRSAVAAAAPFKRRTVHKGNDPLQCSNSNMVGEKGQKDERTHKRNSNTQQPLLCSAETDPLSSLKNLLIRFVLPAPRGAGLRPGGHKKT